MNDDWNQLSVSERIVRAAWMAVREHLAMEHPPVMPADQATRLRRLLARHRLAEIQRPNGGSE